MKFPKKNLQKNFIRGQKEMKTLNLNLQYFLNSGKPFFAKSISKLYFETQLN